MAQLRSPATTEVSLDNITPVQRARLRRVLRKRTGGLSVALGNIVSDVEGVDPESALVSLDTLLRRAVRLRAELQKIASFVVALALV